MRSRPPPRPHVPTNFPISKIPFNNAELTFGPGGCHRWRGSGGEAPGAGRCYGRTHTQGDDDADDDSNPEQEDEARRHVALAVLATPTEMALASHTSLHGWISPPAGPDWPDDWSSRAPVGKYFVFPEDAPPERQSHYVRCLIHPQCRTQPVKIAKMSRMSLYTWLFKAKLPPRGSSY